MTATVRTAKGQLVTGEIKHWLGRRVVEIEDADGNRHIGLPVEETK